MKKDFFNKQYIDFTIYNITKIKNRYGYRIILKYSDGSVSYIQKSGYSTKKEAEYSRNISVTELNTRSFIINNKINIKEYFTEWLEKKMRLNITATTYDTYKNIVYNYVIPKMGSIKMETLNRGHIQKFYNEVTVKSTSIAKLCKTVMLSSLKYAVEENIVGSNVAKDVKLPKCVKNSKYRTIEINNNKTLNEEQINKLLDVSKASPIKLQIMFAVLMGLRRGEINGLKYSDIDFVQRKIKIQRQLGVSNILNKEECNKKQFTKQEIECKSFSSNRELFIPDILFEEILEERKFYEKNKNRRINDKSNPFRDLNYICCSSYGNPRSKSYHFSYWKQILSKNNLPDIRFHDLRATYCTLLVKNNFSLKAISNLMGHSSEIISVDVYTNKKDIIADCMEELEPYIEKLKPKITKTRTNFSRDKEVLNITNNIIESLTV